MPQPRDLPGRVIAWGAVGVIVVCGLVLWLRDSTPAPNSGTRKEAADAFLAAWAESRAGTWKVDATFERTPASGSGALTSPMETVQRPPDRLVRQFGSITGMLDGNEVGCAPGPDDGVRCRTGASVDYAQVTATELERLGEYVAGPVPIYAVTREGPREGASCFRLDRQIEYLAPPYGDQARFCFDPKTGALVKTEVVRAEATDVTTAFLVTSEVTDADFALPAPLE